MERVTTYQQVLGLAPNLFADPSRISKQAYLCNAMVGRLHPLVRPVLIGEQAQVLVGPRELEAPYRLR